MGFKFLPYEIEAVSSSSPLSEGIFGLRQQGNEASWQLLGGNGAELLVFNIPTSIPLADWTQFSRSAREKWNEKSISHQKALMRFLSPLKSQRNVRSLYRETSLDKLRVVAS